MVKHKSTISQLLVAKFSNPHAIVSLTIYHQVCRCQEISVLLKKYFTIYYHTVGTGWPARIGSLVFLVRFLKQLCTTITLLTRLFTVGSCLLSRLQQLTHQLILLTELKLPLLNLFHLSWLEITEIIIVIADRLNTESCQTPGCVSASET